MQNFGDRNIGIRFSAFWLMLLIGAAAASAAQAGEFFIRVEAPSEWKDRRIKDAILVVRAYASGEPTSARIIATAEGLVEGKRQTIHLKVAPASSGVYSIRKEWPSQGIWVVAIQGMQQGIVCSKLVELGPDGTIPANQQTCLCPKCYPWREAEGLHINGESRLPVKTAFHKFTAQEIEAKLNSLADDEGAPRPAAH